MRNDLLMKLEKDEDYFYFLRENPNWHKILSRDRSFVFNSKKDGYNVPGINRLGYKSTNENIDKNIEVAKKLHKECIEPLYDIIKKYTRKNKVPRCLKDFDIRH